MKIALNFLTIHAPSLQDTVRSHLLEGGLECQQELWQQGDVQLSSRPLHQRLHRARHLRRGQLFSCAE